MDCILCGKCKKSCPAYELYREENYSPRGKMALLQAEIEKEKVDFKCFFCGNCISSCPFEIDVPISFLFEKKISYSSSDKSGKVIVVNSIMAFSNRINAIVSNSSLGFCDVVSIDDGVSELNRNNDYNLLEAFYQFLLLHKQDDLYFTEGSSKFLAERIGHIHCHNFIDTFDLEYIKLPKSITRYYEILSKEEIDSLELNIPNYEEDVVVNIAFNFYNTHIKFYLDLL